MIYGGAGLTAAAALTVILMLAGRSAATDASPSQTFSTIAAGDIRISAFGSGTLVAADELGVGFEYGGAVEQILVEVGDAVKEGDLLAVLDDQTLQAAAAEAEADYRELVSNASLAAAALDLAEAQKDVLTAESTLRFYLSPYVYKAELRLQDAQAELTAAGQSAEQDPSEAAQTRLAAAQQAVSQAELSLALDKETYDEEYVPDFFNFPWRDRFGYWHDYYDPPSEIEVDQAWAELDAARARVEEAEYYLAALTEGKIPDGAYGAKVTSLESASESVSAALDRLAAARLTAPMDGIILEIDLVQGEASGTAKAIKLAQLEPPRLEVSFDESDWSLIKPGSPVEVVFDALPEKTYQGQVVFLNPTLQSSFLTTYVSAVVELDLAGSDWDGLPLASGANIELIAGEATNAVLLPLDGLQEDLGDHGTVFVREADGELALREIALGLRDVLYVEVTSGLAVGDVVLIGD